jgi:hypothetical protein
MEREPAATPEPAFLGLIGPDDRTPWRTALWFGLGLAVTIMLMPLVRLLFVLLDPQMVESLDQPLKALAGPDLLYTAASKYALLVLCFAAAAVGFLGSAQFVFRRPARTFVTPARPFDFRLFGLGVAIAIVVVGLWVGLELLRGKTLAPPILDLRYGTVQRIAYGGSAVLFALLFAVSAEALFRGVLLQATGAFVTRRLPLCLLNGAFFALLSAGPDPLAALSQGLIGAVLAWAVLELAGLEYAVAYVFVDTAAQSLLVAPISITEPGQAPRMSWVDFALVAGVTAAAWGGAWALSWLKRRFAL